MKSTDKTVNLVDRLLSMQESGASSDQLYAYYRNYIETMARNKGIPINGTFELTPICNLDCKMCYVHLNKKQFDSSQLLSVYVWKDIILQAYHEGMIKATLSGGECLTYPGFDELYLYMISLGIKVGILTNGILLNANRVNFFTQNRPSIIQISIYGGSNEEYEAVTGKKAFSKVINNVIIARDAGLPLVITITPNRYMNCDISELLSVIESLGVPYNINSKLINPREETGRKKEDISDEQYLDIYIKAKYVTNPLTADLKELEIPEENKQSNTSFVGVKCGAGRSTFTVLYDGRMCPCVGLNNLISYPLRDGFKEAWHTINKMANSYIMPSECGNCIYYKECLVCPALHKDAPIGHCDKRICERTKKLVKAGILPVPLNKHEGC